VRTETNKLVSDLVNLDRVRSLLTTISYRRRFLAHLEQKRMAEAEKDVPQIVVDQGMAEVAISSKDIASLYTNDSTPSSPSPSGRFHTPHVSISLDGPGLQRNSRRASDLSMLSADSWGSP
jgi:voltage-dependent calcium channel